MEAHDQPASDIDLGSGGAEDPFAHVPPDPLAEGDLPPGVQPGSLPGDNPSEEPQPDEILADPEEQDTSPGDEEEYPAAEEPQAEPEPERGVETHSDDPGASGPTTDEEAPAETTEAETDEQPEPETPVARSDAKEKAAEKSEPTEKPKSSKRRGKAKKAKTKSETAATRGYVILRMGSETGEWNEAFERPDPDSEEPFVLESRNGTTALRSAYRLLSESEQEPQEYMLVCVPRNMWQVKKVAGRVHRQTAISVG